MSWGIVVLAGWPTLVEGEARASPLDSGPVGQVAGQELSTRVGVGWKRGEVPRFRASPRDSLGGVVDAAWQPVDRVGLGVAWRGGASWTALGQTVAEPGRITLQSRADLVPVGRSAVVVQAGWRASIPVVPAAAASADTGEADIDLLFSVGHQSERWRIFGVGGLGITGNPLLDGAQDDLPLLWLTGGWTAAGVDLDARVGGALATSRNPGRTGVLLSAERRGPLLLGAELGLGLAPAAADVRIAAWTGLAWGCLRACGD